VGTDVRRLWRTTQSPPPNLGRVLIVAALILAAVLVGPPAVRLIRGYHDLASLPGGIHICDRTYTRDAASEPPWTMAKMSAGGITPVVVDPGPFGLFTACAPGVCTATADGPCATVIFVRVDEGTYIGYSLSGGP
jgi:hypothetical protein